MFVDMVLRQHVTVASKMFRYLLNKRKESASGSLPGECRLWVTALCVHIITFHDTHTVNFSANVSSALSVDTPSLWSRLGMGNKVLT